MNEIVAFITAVSHLTNATKALFQAHDQAAQDSVRMKLNDALLDLQSKVSEVQLRYQQLLESNEHMKRQIAEYDNWNEEKTRYALHKIGSGTFVYRLKPEHQDGQPEHFICPNCYEERKKSLIQREGAPIHVVCSCPRCKATFSM